jgi:DNA-binding winged helix-turn-helix (wHTH) protein/TolB-like protein
MTTSQRRYRFDGLVFDAQTGEVEGPPGTIRRLPPKAARLLAMLLARPGQLVPREEVRREIWPEEHIELDQVLAYTIHQVRDALGDDAAQPRLVETLPRRGYRFVGRLEEDAVEARAPLVVARGKLSRSVVVGVALLAAIALGAWGLWANGARTAAASASVRVAFIPLGMTPEADAESNDALTDALVIALTEHRELELVGPATTAALRGTTRPHTDIGRELGVSFVLSGEYRPAKRLLFLQLVRARDGRHVFAGGYRGDVAAVERQLGEAARAISATATRER